MLKEVVKAVRVPVKMRIIPMDVVAKFGQRITELEVDVRDVLRMEKELSSVTRKVDVAEKLLKV